MRTAETRVDALSSPPKETVIAKIKGHSLKPVNSTPVRVKVEPSEQKRSYLQSVIEGLGSSVSDRMANMRLEDVPESWRPKQN